MICIYDLRTPFILKWTGFFVDIYGVGGKFRYDIYSECYKGWCIG